MAKAIYCIGKHKKKTIGTEHLFKHGNNKTKQNNIDAIFFVCVKPETIFGKVRVWCVFDEEIGKIYIKSNKGKCKRT